VGLRLGHALLVGLRSRCSVCVCAGGEPQSTAAQDARGCDGTREDVDQALRLVGIHDFSFVVLLDFYKERRLLALQRNAFRLG
jgi:hypothetical protein